MQWLRTHWFCALHSTPLLCFLFLACVRRLVFLICLISYKFAGVGASTAPPLLLADPKVAALSSPSQTSVKSRLWPADVLKIKQHRTNTVQYSPTHSTVRNQYSTTQHTSYRCIYVTTDITTDITAHSLSPWCTTLHHAAPYVPILAENFSIALLRRDDLTAFGSMDEIKPPSVIGLVDCDRSICVSSKSTLAVSLPAFCKMPVERSAAGSAGSAGSAGKRVSRVLQKKRHHEHTR